MSKCKNRLMLSSNSEFITGNWLQKEGIDVMIAFNTCHTHSWPTKWHVVFYIALFFNERKINLAQSYEI